MEALTSLRELAKHRGVFFKIIIYESASHDMLCVVRDNPEDFCSKLSELIGGIDVEMSHCTFEKEKMSILKQIENFGTFDMLNCNISGIVENWAFDMLRQMTLEVIKTGDKDALFCFRHSLAMVFTQRGRLNEALQQRELRMEWLYQLLDQQEIEDSADLFAITVALAEALMDVAEAYARLKRFRDALKFQQEAQKYYKRVLGEDDLQHAKIMASIAQTYFNLEEEEIALRLIMSTQEFHRRVLPQNDPVVFSSEAAVAAMYRDMRDFENAFEIERQVLEKRLQNLPSNHPDIGSSHFNIALTLPFIESLPRSERNSGILENLHIAVNVWRNSLTASDPRLLLAKQKIEVFEESLKQDTRDDSKS
jgi:tetratricopeptide (TPR) repeat protein